MVAKQAAVRSLHRTHVNMPFFGIGDQFFIPPLFHALQDINHLLPRLRIMAIEQRTIEQFFPIGVKTFCRPVPGSSYPEPPDGNQVADDMVAICK